MPAEDTSHYLYLVSLCHTLDDVPMRICSDVGEAFRFAHTLSWVDDAK